MKILKWILGVILGLLVLLLLLFHLAAGWFRFPDRQIEKKLSKAGVPHQIHKQSYRDFSLRWIEAGDPEASTLVFLFHGAPGGFGDYSAFMEDEQLTREALLLTFDRPGYGASRYGQPMPSIVEQVEAARFVLDRYQADSVVLVGYSYGGPIAGAFAARYPERVKALLLLASVQAPEAEKIFWFNPWLDTRLARWLFPPLLHVANEEKLGHAEALNVIRDDWKKIEAPVVHLHCTDDWIAPYEENVAWSRTHIPPEQLEIVSWTGGSHFLPNQQKERIKPILLGLIREARAKLPAAAIERPQ